MIDKLKAAFVHLLISAVVLSLTTYFFVSLFYPTPFFELEGVYKLIYIFVTVDIIAGPVLMFIIYKKGKTGLRKDITVIATIQLLAYLFGIYSFYTSRPAFVVFSDVQFYLVSPVDIDTEKLKNSPVDLNWVAPPKPVVAKVDNVEEHQSILHNEIFSGAPGLQFKPEYYVEYEKGVDLVKAALKELGDIDGLINSEFERKLKQKGLTAEQVGATKILGRAKKMIVIVNRTTGEIEFFLPHP